MLLVNRIPQKSKLVYGREILQYVVPGKDTIPIRLENGLAKGQQGMLVMDTYGNTNLVPLQTLQADTAKSFKSLM